MKIKNEKFLAALFSLVLVYIFHLISLKYAIGNGLKVLAFVGFLVNLASSFNINIP